MAGHCSNCGKVWTLDTQSGVCQWCEQIAVCHSSTAKPRHIKSSSKRTKRQAQAPDNGYEQLNGEWRDWLEVARKYEHRVPGQDRYDIRHIIMIELARARARDGQPIPILRAYRIASLMVALYWRQIKRQPTILSLDEPTSDYEGNQARLIDTIADDKAIDLDAWLDAKTWLLGCPMRLIEIATKKLDGKALNGKDRQYLSRYRLQEQKRLV